jgi:ribA/ribD-fused uncharacterized protein
MGRKKSLMDEVFDLAVADIAKAARKKAGPGPRLSPIHRAPAPRRAAASARKGAAQSSGPTTASAAPVQRSLFDQAGDLPANGPVDIFGQADEYFEPVGPTGERFTFFWKGPFSQWHPSPFKLHGRWFTHAEQYMMFRKAMLFGDLATADRVLCESSPDRQKAIGRLTNPFCPRRWAAFREAAVVEGNLAKYRQNADLGRLLIDTVGTSLAEASPYDAVWGIGLGENDRRAVDRTKWPGLNLLGAALEQVRTILVEGGATDVRA